MTYTFALSQRSLPVRCLCVLLCVLVLWCFFMVPRAGAVVAEAELAYWGGAIIVSVLAAGGMALATGDAQKVGSAMYSALKDTGGKAWDSIQAMAAWAASAGSKVKDAAFRVGKDVWQAITDCFNNSYSDGSFLIDGNSFSFDASSEDYNAKRALFDAFNTKNFSRVSVSSSSGLYIASFSLVEHGSYECRWSSSISSPSGLETCSDVFGSFCAVKLASHYRSCGFVFYGYKADGSIYNYSDIEWIGAEGDTVVTGYYGIDVSLSGDLVYPGDDYLVKVPDIPATDSVTGALAWPSDAVYTKDAIAVPYPVDSEGVKVPDIPYDKALDKSTGKTLDDTDTGTDTKPGEDTDTGASTAGLIGSIIELLKNFFDSPSDFKLNFDGFKESDPAGSFSFLHPI